ncbi:MAG TPA: 3-phosphoshikimate 1-carboxyvinyltransferase, partial [Candidatus Berkiella sp.]|nr:3-phosphoshikimate 1-carboxyvinyltransferase [Candidatus Berkiella sp.]
MIVNGQGLDAFSAPSDVLDCGNSGTSMRLFAGLLSAQPFVSTLVGDFSLSKRPMARVVSPLTQMGAKISGHWHNQQVVAPLSITPSDGLQAICYEMPVASAQVKSSLLRAGLYAKGETIISEKVASRDHTERLLRYLGADITAQRNQIKLNPQAILKGKELSIPADISSAAFFIAGASATLGAHILLKGIGINPTRMGLIHILQAMGAQIVLHEQRYAGFEPIADIEVKGTTLQGIDVPEKWVVSAIDEFPVLFIAAAFAQGETRFTGLAELRYKETDRIAMMAQGMEKLGVTLAILPDGIIIRGSKITGGIVDSGGDHRIAMAFAIAALQASGPITIQYAEQIATSFQSFCDIANLLGLST